MLHLVITSTDVSPSCFWHGVINIYRRLTSTKLSTPSSVQLEKKKMIVFVHGRGGHHTNFVSLITNLKEREQVIDYGYVLIDLGWNASSSIDDDVSRLSQELQRFSDCKITLIGVSKGGLVCTRYITTQKDSRIRRVITISSPLRGTQATMFLSSNSITDKELCYHSHLTETVAQANKPVPVYHIVPRWDHVIIPTSSAQYDDTPSNNIYYWIVWSRWYSS